MSEQKQIPTELIQPIAELLIARKKVYDAKQEFVEKTHEFNMSNFDLSENGIGDCKVLVEHDGKKVMLIIDEDGNFYDFEKTNFDYEVKF